MSDDLGPEGVLYRVDWDPSVDDKGIIGVLADASATLLSATGKRNRWTFRLRVDDRGYFDEPRRATLDDLASELGITRQSLAGRLRRGHRNLLAGLFGFGEQVQNPAVSAAQD